MLSLSPLKPRLPKLLLLVVIIILGIYLVEVLRENESIKRYLKNEHKFEFKSFLSSRKNSSKILVDEKVELVNSTTTTEEPKRDNNRVFCLIKSYLNNYRNNVTTMIYDVWGRKCDEHRVIMMIPEELRTPDWKIGEEYEVLGQPFNILQPKLINESTHMNITDKIYSSIVSIYKRFPDYEWYYLVDDDSYVNVANLKQFLADKNSSHPITYGFEFKTNVRQGYHSGGSGYVLSNEAFRRIGQQLDANYTFCPNSGVEDLDVNRCLRELGVEMGVSVDERGRQRFLVLDLMRHYLGAFPNWLYRFSLHPLKKGVDCCSDSIIAVHYMNPRDVLRLDIAIETQINVVEMYKKHIDMNRNVTFRDVFRNYISLKIFENQKNIENSTLNGIF